MDTGPASSHGKSSQSCEYFPPPLQVEFMGLQSMARLQASGNLLAVALVVPDAVNLGDIARRNKAVDA